MIITDFHAHILPGLDHGSDSLNTSLKQLELMRRYGTQRVVATSHFYPFMYSNAEEFIEERQKSLETLLNGSDPKCRPAIIPAAEVFVCNGIEHLPGIEKLVVEGTRCMLLEMPDNYWNVSLYDSILALTERGFEIILAHIDRYPFDGITKLMKYTGVRAQLNVSVFSLGLRFKKYMPLVRSGDVVAIGSDLHMINKSRYKRFAGVRKKFPGVYASVMSRSDALLAGAQEY